jgi:hypothetical protein
MVDLVGTCPKLFWEDWIAEGDAAGEVESGEEWAWFTASPVAARVRVGERFYVVAHGRLRGWASVTRVAVLAGGREWAICRRGGAVACTVPLVIPGFRGLRVRWWDRSAEVAFPDWRVP